MAPPTPAPDCSTQDNTRADGMSGKLIHDLITGGPGPGSLNLASQAAVDLTANYAGIEARLRTVSASLGEGWTGTSADAAQQAASPINKAVIDMQNVLPRVDRSVDNQGYQFSHNKGQLKQLPDQKPESGFWNDHTPWTTDTDRAISGFNSDEAENRRVYTEYQGASGTNRGELPAEIAGVTTDTLDVDVVGTSNDGTGDLTANSNGKQYANPSSSNWTGGTNQPAQTGTYTPPAQIPGNNPSDTTNTSGVHDGQPPPAHKPPPVHIGPPLQPSPVSGPPAYTGLPPGGFPPPNRGGLGGTPPGGGAPSGRSGVGGSAPVGSRTGANNPLGPGAKAGLLGPGGGQEVGGGRGSQSGARGGAAGGAMMGGAGAGKGQGDEDSEHRIADYLITEEHGNEIVGDLGMTAPPTIGA